MNRWISLFASFLVVLCLGALLHSCKSPPTQSTAPPPEASRISKEKLKELLDDPGLILIDTRVKQQWAKAEFKLPGARHGSPWTPEEWGKELPRDQIIVTYCA